MFCLMQHFLLFIIFQRQRKMMLERENIQENRQLIEEAKARLKLEAEEEANAIQIHANAKIRIAKMRKQKEFQVQNVLVYDSAYSTLAWCNLICQ